MPTSGQLLPRFLVIQKGHYTPSNKIQDFPVHTTIIPSGQTFTSRDYTSIVSDHSLQLIRKRKMLFASVSVIRRPLADMDEPLVK